MSFQAPTRPRELHFYAEGRLDEYYTTLSPDYYQLRAQIKDRANLPPWPTRYGVWPFRSVANGRDKGVNLHLFAGNVSTQEGEWNAWHYTGECGEGDGPGYAFASKEAAEQACQYRETEGRWPERFIKRSLTDVSG